jgi:hypothetical protein
MSKLNLNVLQKYAFFALKWFFFGFSPKPIPLPKSKPRPQNDESEGSENCFQFVPNESKNGALTWQKSDFVPKTKPAPQMDNTSDAVTKEPQREPFLNENDESEIQKRGLDIQKAITIKVYWFDNINRFLAANQINKRGFSESVISRYYAAFNAPFYVDSEGENN